MKRALTIVSFVALVCTQLSAQNDDGGIEGSDQRCSYSVEADVPTGAIVSNMQGGHLFAKAITFGGCYEGRGEANAYGLLLGGTAVAVATGTFKYTIEHHGIENCLPVLFRSDTRMRAKARAYIDGDDDDYAFAGGLQQAQGFALPQTAIQVAAVCAGAPVGPQGVQIGFSPTGPALTFTIPSAGGTGNTEDADEKQTSNSGVLTTEIEILEGGCWTKIKDSAVSTLLGPGGYALSYADYGEMTVGTKSTCTVHGVTVKLLGTYEP